MDANSPPLVLPNYPYLKKFDSRQLAEAMDRKDRLVELLMDPVGPDGTLINIPVDMLHILAFHLAFAGADTHTDTRQLIESRVIRDNSQMFEMYEWRPRGEFAPEPESDEDDELGDEAAGIAATMREQLTPELRAALTEILLQEYQAANPELSKRARAENILTEQREMRANTKEAP